MSDKIKIKNYGPLEIGTTELDGGSMIVPKFTFFIGDQGTGKSTIAKRRKKHRELPYFLVYSAANFEPSTLQKGLA